MNEKLQYAEMLEIPYSTCSVNYKPPKKRLFKVRKKPDAEVKGELIDKINQSAEPLEVKPDKEIIEEKINEVNGLVNVEKTEIVEQELNNIKPTYQENETVVIRAKKKPKLKINILAVQFALIGVLALTIILTNALLPQSGINTFISKVFGGNEQSLEVVDERLYTEFDAGLPTDNAQIVLSEGVMTFSNDGTIYPSCDGVVSAIENTENGYTVEITHNSNFKTVMTGLTHAYFGLNDMVKSNIPVGYAESDFASVCFYNGDGLVITNYTVGENGVEWVV